MTPRQQLGETTWTTATAEMDSMCVGLRRWLTHSCMHKQPYYLSTAGPLTTVWLRLTRTGLDASCTLPWAVVLGPAKRPSVSCKQPHARREKYSENRPFFTRFSSVFRPILGRFSRGFRWRHRLTVASKAIEECSPARATARSIDRSP